ncbi:MAG: protein kinase [Polyangia bacterium]
MGAVFRAQDRLAARTVALKSVLPSRRAEPAPDRPRRRLDAAAALAETMDADLAATAPGTHTAGTAATALPSHALATEDADEAGALALRLALTREFATLASLRHPHIVSVLDYGFDGQLPFFTMEYLPASRDLLSVARHSPLRVRVELLAQIAQALAYLHRRGTLHRDLKPSAGATERAAQGIGPDEPRSACHPTRSRAERCLGSCRLQASEQTPFNQRSCRMPCSSRRRPGAERPVAPDGAAKRVRQVRASS